MEHKAKRNSVISVGQSKALRTISAAAEATRSHLSLMNNWHPGNC